MTLNRLKYIREQKGYTQEFVARSVGISLVCYNRIENGVSNPKISTVVSILKILNCKLEDII